MQKLLNIIIIGIILYGIVHMKLQDEALNVILKKFTSNNKTSEVIRQSDSDQVNNLAVEKMSDNHKPQDSKLEESELQGSFLEKTLSSVLINVLKTNEGKLFLENILTPINNTSHDQGFKINNNEMLTSMFRVSTFDEGKIGPASCGHVVTAHYQIIGSDNTIIEEQDKTFSLGSRPSIPALDAVIVGMKTGQSRQAIIPAKYAYANNKTTNPLVKTSDSYKLKVRLDEIMPKNFVIDAKIFDDEISYQMPLMCGDRVSFDAIITNLANGKKIFDSTEEGGKKINMLIGDIAYPLIFSHALHGKIPFGTRTVIAKGNTFQGLGANITKIFPKKDQQLPVDEYYMLELKNFTRQ